MTNGFVLCQRHDSIVTLTLNRPESLNAMNEAMMGEIERILIELEADTAVRGFNDRHLTEKLRQHQRGPKRQRSKL